MNFELVDFIYSLRWDMGIKDINYVIVKILDGVCLKIY